ncbi:MAG TPA: D-sedoheptulose 7-phosphate isomerase [Candidatus Gastranaerophilales bacterium]|nr:D-sedoheptulose 7-phosphate isomerase [Candidatus Gastranaerophilales bacterium]
MEQKTFLKKEIIIGRIDETLDVLNQTKKHIELIELAANIIINAFKAGKKLLICGNGGSAADSQHIAAEMIGKFYRIDRPALPAIALSTNTSIITAIGNDFGYEKTFVRQVEALGQKDDVLLSISTSGNSENALEASKLAKQKGMKIISLTGDSGGMLKDISDITITIPSNNTPIIQNAHITICHIICELVENEF